MKKYLQYALMIVCLATLFSSCKDDGENAEEAAVLAYKLENERAFAAKSSDPEFFRVSIQGNGDYFIYAKRLKDGNQPAIPIYYNSCIMAYYKGSFINGEVFDKREFEDGMPMDFAVSSAAADAYISAPIPGWTLALQNMTVGEKWEVWIPWQLAYGNANYDGDEDGVVDIPGYSTLVFEIEVVKRTVEAVGGSSAG